MRDEEFLLALTACTLPPDQFHHADHLRAAWLYLRRLPTTLAISKFSEVLRAYATSLGKPDRYHETITWAYLLLVNERMHRCPNATSWEEFVGRNRDLFDWTNSILMQYYCPETLHSALAREVFLMPDRLQPQ
jgi:hypothetical protein